MGDPTVSIIVPSFNRVEYLAETLNSVRAQTLKCWEVLVVDDCSTDGTESYVRNLEKEDARVHYFKRQGARGNANVCRNQGLARACGDYVVFLDSDDLLMESCLEHRVAVMNRNLDLDFAVFPALRFTDCPEESAGTFGAWNGAGDLDRLLLLDWPIQTTGPIWRRRVFERIGTWDERLPSWQDWEFLLRAIAFGSKYLRFHDHDYYFRVKRNEDKTSNIQFKSEYHLYEAASMLDRVYDLLHKKGLISGFRCKLISRIYLQLALAMLNNPRGLRSSLEIWRHVRLRPIVAKRSYLSGIIILYINQYWAFRKGKYFRNIEYVFRKFGDLG